jgi:hypothetical protein
LRKYYGHEESYNSLKVEVQCLRTSNCRVIKTRERKKIGNCSHASSCYCKFVTKKHGTLIIVHLSRGKRTTTVPLSFYGNHLRTQRYAYVVKKMEECITYLLNNPKKLINKPIKLCQNHTTTTILHSSLNINIVFNIPSSP